MKQPDNSRRTSRVFLQWCKAHPLPDFR
jgi:hypothetical protein